jgi:transposase-like protein
METETLRCPKCGKDGVRPNGYTRTNERRWRCSERLGGCGHSWSNTVLGRPRTDACDAECPHCYNPTTYNNGRGLRRCPECGKTFRLERLGLSLEEEEDKSLRITDYVNLNTIWIDSLTLNSLKFNRKATIIKALRLNLWFSLTAALAELQVIFPLPLRIWDNPPWWKSQLLGVDSSAPCYKPSTKESN